MSSGIRALTKTVKYPDGILHFRAKSAFPQNFRQWSGNPLWPRAIASEDSSVTIPALRTPPARPRS